MKVRTLVVAAAAGLVLTVSGAAGAQQLETEFDKALALVLVESQNDFCAQKDVLSDFVDDERFNDAPEPLRIGALGLAGGCAYFEERYETAYIYTYELSNLVDLGRYGTAELIQLALASDRHENLPELVIEWTESDPQTSAPGVSYDMLYFERRMIRSAVYRIQKTPEISDQELPVLQALRDDDYRYTGKFESGDDERYRHARLLLKQGDTEKARTLLSEIREPEQMRHALIDRRFDVALADPRFQNWADQRARYEERKAYWLEIIESNPDYLEPIVSIIDVYARLGEHDAAEALITERLSELQDSTTAFTDQKHYENWLRDKYAGLLEETDRDEEAFAQMRRAVAVGEHGGTSVSQTLNLASKLCSNQRATEAVETLQLVPEAMSGYGKTVKAGVEVCAYAQLEDQERLSASLQYLEENSRDGWQNLFSAYVWANQFDKAAELFKTALADEEDRLDALQYVQRMAGEDGVYEEQFDDVADERKAQIFSRPDIEAAIDAVGYRKTWNLSEIY